MSTTALPEIHGYTCIYRNDVVVEVQMEYLPYMPQSVKCFSLRPYTLVECVWAGTAYFMNCGRDCNGCAFRDVKKSGNVQIEQFPKGSYQ